MQKWPADKAKMEVWGLPQELGKPGTACGFGGSHGPHRNFVRKKRSLRTWWASVSFHSGWHPQRIKTYSLSSRSLAKKADTSLPDVWEAEGGIKLVLSLNSWVLSGQRLHRRARGQQVKGMARRQILSLRVWMDGAP
jgi:hypothetical protein